MHPFLRIIGEFSANGKITGAYCEILQECTGEPGQDEELVF